MNLPAPLDALDVSYATKYRSESGSKALRVPNDPYSEPQVERAIALGDPLRVVAKEAKERERSEVREIAVNEGTSIGKAVGDPYVWKDKCPNESNDVRIVKAFLNKAMGKELPLSGVVTSSFIECIYEFQFCFRDWLRNPENMNGLILPDGPILKRLKHLAFGKLHLNWVRPNQLVWEGGYTVNFALGDSSVQTQIKEGIEGYQFFLKLAADDSEYEVVYLNYSWALKEEKDPRKEKLKRDDYTQKIDGELVRLIKTIAERDKKEKGKVWGTRLPCSLVMKFKGEEIRSSNSVMLQTPPMAIHKDELGPTLNGAVTWVKYGGGDCWLIQIGDYFLFCRGRKIELDKRNINLVCTTYVSSILGLDWRYKGIPEVPPWVISNGQPKDGDPMTCSDLTARAADAKKVNFNGIKLEKVSWEVARDFLTKNKTGVYLAWTQQHLRIVVHGIVHEYRVLGRNLISRSVDGYPFRELWKDKNKIADWWIRKVPDNHEIAKNWKP